MLKKIIFYSIAGSIILTGCQNVIQPITDTVTDGAKAIRTMADEEKQKQSDKSQAMINCQELCQNTLSANGRDFEVGPCLSNEILPDWVCDIAHSPRQPVDNDPANQCSAFNEAEASHFVEVDGNCNIIKVY